MEGLDDPVTPRPQVRIDVGLISEGVGVAGDVEPVGGQVFSVGFGGQESIHSLLVTVRRIVFEERVEVRDLRGEPREVEGCAPQQRRCGGLRGGR